MNIGALVLGGVFGFLTMLFMKTRHSTDNRLIIAITMLLTFCGICSLCDVSPLLGCMAMGTVYMNTTEDERLFAQLNYFSPPILVLFFVRSGTSFDLGSLFGSSGSIDGRPLIVIGVGYFIVRVIGKYAGAFLGCQIAHKPVEVRNYLGFALIPQAGVAIGLAEMGARTLGGSVGHSLHTIILASSILYELIGPAAAKASLALSGSYSNELEQITTVDRVTAAGVEKPPVELLIERIQKIQEEMAREKNPYEDIFEDEAEAFLNQEEDQAPKPKKKKKCRGKKKKETEE
jgi:Kef-type K+ transport system membrane component KefB